MKTTKDSPNLDLLRSLAVSFVVFFHLLLLFQKTKSFGIDFSEIGGWGVLIFFVHTSLVLMFSLERQQRRLPGQNIAWPFYLRRCFRVFPLSMLAVLVVAAFRIPVWDFHGVFRAVHLTTGGLFSDLFLVQNLTHTESNLAVLWSLPYEMQMYLVLPALFLLARKTRTILPLLMVWVCAAVVARASFHFHDLSPLLYVPCFVPGIVAYKLTTIQKPWLPFFLWPCAIAMMTAFYLYDASPRSKWFCCLVVGFAIPQFRELSNAWLKKICHYVARYSYGVYIMHLICMWIAFDVMARDPLFVRWIVFAISLVGSSVFLYDKVEAPMIALGNRLVERLAERQSVDSQAIA